MASDTRARIVDAARELFWRQGYEATSLAQIAEHSSARTGSIYYFFKTKADILDAVIDHYEDQLGVWLIDPVFRRTDRPLERVFGVIETYRSFLVETHFTLGCPVGGLAIEIPSELDAARARIGSIFAALEHTLTECLAEAEVGGGSRPPAAALATLVLTVIEGGIVQARATKSIEPFDRSVACLKDYVQRLGNSDLTAGATP